jgi:geranylgeranyl diphosphate synthase, type II
VVGTLVHDVLEEYGALTRQALACFLEEECEKSPLYRMAADYPLRRGRSLRASFCIAAARAFGASMESAVRSALSLELLHNAFLVHDDIEDESDERRGQPTLHRLHGVPLAVNAGDALVVLGLRPLLGNRVTLGPRIAWQILEEAERMVRETVEGQSQELCWRRYNTFGLTVSDYLGMTLKKTCWYTTIYPSRVGALIGTRGQAKLDELVRFGFFLGAAFQIQDDVLNLAGDAASYGKELSGDLLEGKRTLMLIHLMGRLASAERVRLEQFLGTSRGERTAEDVAWLRKRMKDAGSLDYARSVANALAGAAQHEFSVAYASLPDSRDKRFIESLPRWVIERS